MDAGHDFPDRLSPFLVKELRQGLASGAYRAFFLIVAAAVALNVVLCTLAESAHQSAILKGVLFFLLCPVFPLSSLGAILAERRGKKLELLVMTRLTSWRIVAGMWLVRAAQAALLVAVALPGLLLGYFDGGVNVVGDLAFVVTAYAGCVTATAVTLFASGLLREGNTVINIIVRCVTVFGIIYGSSMLAGLATMLVFTGGYLSAFLGIPLFAAAVLTPLFLFFAGLTLGVGFRTSSPSSPKPVS